MVIHNICQVIGRQLVGTLVEHLIVADITLHANLTANQVVDQDFLSTLNLETNNILIAGSNQRIDLFLWKGQRVTHLAASMAVVLEML